MVVSAEILTAEDKVKGPFARTDSCACDNDICTDSRVHHRDAENRAPVTRNHRSAPSLDRWLTRDPIGYRGGINLYGYVKSDPVRMADPEGPRKISFAFDASINGNRRGHWLPMPYSRGVAKVLTDWRGFGEFNPHGGPSGDGNARLYSYGWVNSCDIGHLAAGDFSVKSADGVSMLKGKLLGIAFSRVGRAHPHSYFSHYAWSSPTMLMPSVIYEAVPYKVRNPSPSESRILIQVYASFPLAPFAPAIEYKIAFNFSRANANYVNVTLTGEHTPFPDFEGYINGQLIYHAESPHKGPNESDLGFNSPWVQIPPTAGLGVQG
jgi:RHS repeat-associated protein